MRATLSVAVVASLLVGAGAGLADKKDDVAKLIQRLKSPFSSEVANAARALERMGPEAKEAVPALTEAMARATFPDERVALARALARMGPAAAPSAPVLAQTLKRASFSNERTAIIKAIGQLGPAGRDATLPLTEILRSTYTEDARAAAEALGNIGPAARDAVPALTLAARAGSPGLRTAAAEALKKIRSRDDHIGLYDHGLFFSGAAKAKAADEIYDLVGRFQLDVRVETFMHPPGDYEKKLQNASTAEQTRLMESWAQERAGGDFNGIHILVCRNPGYIHVTVSPASKTRFDDKAVERLTEALNQEFRSFRYDAGLLGGLARIRQQLAKGSGQ